MQSGLFLKAGRFEEPGSEEALALGKSHTRALLLPLEGRNGFAFALWYAHPKHGWNQTLSNTLGEHVSRLAAAFGAEANPQHRFEQFLSALNEQLAGHVREGAWRLPIKDFHAVVGIACETHLFLSGNGDLTALFLHRKPGNRYQVFNLFRSIQTGQALPTWEKAFAVVLDGDLHPGDVLCLSNKELSRVVSPDDLHGSLATLPPAGATERIRHSFSPHAELALLILQAQETETASKAARPLANVSVGHLEETEHQTTELLEDQKPALVRRAQQLAQKLFGLRPRIPASTGRQRFRALRFLANVLWSGVRLFVRLLIFAGRLLVSRERQRHAWQGFRTQTDKSAQGLLDRFNRLPARSKYLWVGAIAVLFVFVIGLTILNRSQTRFAAEAAYEGTVEQVEKKRDEAAAAVIYKDEQRARTLYEEAEKAALALPEDTDFRRETRNRLLREIRAALDQVRHVVTIEEPPLVGTLPLTVAGTALVRANRALYVFASDRGVYQLDTAQKTLKKLPTADSAVGVGEAADANEARVLFLDNRPGISVFDTAGNLLQVTDLEPPTNSRWTDLAAYANRLYLLELPEDGDARITRFSPTTSGWSAPVSWIKSKTTPLDNAVGLAIDATIFVLKKNGVLVRFAGGNEVAWTQEAADPIVEDATDVWTDSESAFVYVLEPTSRRLLVYKKESGALAAQYRFPSLETISDLAVDEPNATLYLLSGASLYAIRASHL